MTTGTKGSAAKRAAWVGLGVLVVFFGLCTIFALVVTVAEAWQEHAQTNWPEITGRVEQCDLERSSTEERQMFRIHCRLSYEVGSEQNTANVYSRNVPSADVWQYPPNQVGPFVDWVNEHSDGSEILVRYDPAHHGKVVVLATPMPGGPPHTPNNIKLLEFCAGGFVVLWIIVRIAQPRSAWPSGQSSMPLNS